MGHFFDWQFLVQLEIGHDILHVVLAAIFLTGLLHLAFSVGLLK